MKPRDREQKDIQKYFHPPESFLDPNMSAKPYGNFVKKGRPWYKIVSSIIFSRFGLFFLCMLYAVGGEREKD